jgi:LacI family transcriptional regulator, galactose operon repressor
MQATDEGSIVAPVSRMDAASEQIVGAAETDACSVQSDRPRRPVTMRDVAAVAGVSISAVSYVLNNTRPVRADKRARVLQAMSDLEYVPNGMAQALRRTRSGLLGVILPDLSNRPYGQLARHIEATAREAGYMTIICNSAGDDDALASAYVRNLEALRVDGFILRATREQQELLPSVIQTRAPAVLMMSDLPSTGHQLDRVMIDHPEGVRMAVRHLAEAGHTRIGLVTTEDLSRPTRVRLHSFLQGMADVGLDVDMDLVRVGVASAEVGTRLVGELLDSPRPPTALVVAHGRQSIGALRAIRARRIQVPDDLSLIVFGRPDYFDLFAVDLTTVILPLPEMGAAAARLLLERIDLGQQSDRPPRQIILTPSLHTGDSVGPPRKN